MLQSLPRPLRIAIRVLPATVSATLAFGVGASWYGPLDQTDAWRYLPGAVFGLVGFAAGGVLSFLAMNRGLKKRGHVASAGFRELTAEGFDEAIASSGPLLVDFWAEWCVPCHALAPTVKEVADTMTGRLSVAKFNISEPESHQAMSRGLGVMSIPTLILFVDGRERTRLTGAGRKAQDIIAELEPHLS